MGRQNCECSSWVFFQTFFSCTSSRFHDKCGGQASDGLPVLPAARRYPCGGCRSCILLDLQVQLWRVFGAQGGGLRAGKEAHEQRRQVHPRQYIQIQLWRELRDKYIDICKKNMFSMRETRASLVKYPEPRQSYMSFVLQLLDFKNLWTKNKVMQTFPNVICQCLQVS